MPGPAQELLFAIKEHVSARARERGCDVLMVTFNRRELREATRWSDHNLRSNLEKLAEMEYVEVATGSFGKRYVYTLTPDHRLILQAGLPIEEKIRALGLTPASQLETRSPGDLAQRRPTLRRKQATSRG